MDFILKSSKNAAKAQMVSSVVGGIMNHVSGSRSQPGGAPGGGGYPPNPGYPGQSQYPPNTGYPPAPGQPSYPPAPGQSPYPPAPGQSAYPPYPGQNPYGPPGQGAYPPAPGQSPYPPAPGQTPYPPAPGQSPYPPAAAPYPPGPGQNPYPPGPGQSPYPSDPFQSGYPPAQGQSPYPPTPGQSAYPPTPGQPGYPPTAGQSAYPPVPGQSGYPPDPSQAYYAGQNSGAYPANPAQPPYGASPYPPNQAGHLQQSSAYSSYAAPTVGSSLPYTEMPTVKQAQLFDPSSDAALLRKAMKGFGTDEKAIINILSRRTSYQRQAILQRYSQSYGKDLVKDLKGELSGKFEDVIIALMTPLPQYLAKECHDAIMGIGTNERTLVEILCTRDNASLTQIKEAYRYLYKKNIQDDIRGDTSGDFKRLLISICTAFREEGQCNPALAPDLAQQLYKAGEGRTGTNEAEFNRILSTYSYELLRCVFAEYHKIKGKSFEHALDAELSGDIKIGMKAVYNAIQNRAGFFAKEIRDSMAGLGTKDKALIRLIVSRCEIDMVNIKQEYQKMFHKPLEKDIEGDISGDYKHMLLGLVQN